MQGGPCSDNRIVADRAVVQEDSRFDDASDANCSVAGDIYARMDDGILADRDTLFDVDGFRVHYFFIDAEVQK